MSRDAAAAEAMREVESLREVARLKDEFLGQVSHELRTPLTIIHGYAELIADGSLRKEGQIRETAAEVHENSSLMLRLVDDLLDTSRLESGRLSLKYEITDLAPWLERTTAAFAQASSTHRIVSSLPGSLPLARVDLARLGQVVNNLLTNAVRYSPEGSEVWVSARTLRSGELEIRVADQGIGIRPMSVSGSSRSSIAARTAQRTRCAALVWAWRWPRCWSKRTLVRFASKARSVVARRSSCDYRRPARRKR